MSSPLVFNVVLAVLSLTLCIDWILCEHCYWSPASTHFILLSSTPTNEEEQNADVLINAGDILKDWKWPDNKGLDIFTVRLLHTAAWVRSWSPTTST